MSTVTRRWSEPEAGWSVSTSLVSGGENRHSCPAVRRSGSHWPGLLVIEPDLLLLDEPLSALDVTTRMELRRVLARHLDDFPGPRLVITHDPTEAFLLADEVHIIENGSVTQSGSPDELRLRPRTSYAADLAGSNLLFGRASHGQVDVGSHLLHLAEHEIEGEVLLTIRPSSISLHRSPPEGSPRNAWETTIAVMERLGERTRIRTGAPLPLTVEVTSEATSALALDVGETVWLAIKATEIGVEAGGCGDPLRVAFSCLPHTTGDDRDG